MKNITFSKLREREREGWREKGGGERKERRGGREERGRERPNKRKNL